MPSISNIAISTIALLASIQYCPAPSAVAKAGIGGITDIIDSIGGLATTIDGIVKNHEGNKRDLVSFNSRINRRDYGLGTAPQDCQNQLHGAYVTFSQPSSNTIQVQGVPPACMTLSTVITGTLDEGNPVPMGSDSIRFTNLSDGDIQTIKDALQAHG